MPPPPPAPITTDHIFVLGDDIEGPHSTAIAIGKRSILGCAHSLSLTEDPVKRSTKRKQYFSYIEDYWIQPRVAIGSDGSWEKDGRILIKLYKFHPDNDWALFVRADGSEFSSFVTIDTSPSTLPVNSLPDVSKPFVILHCPVGLLHNYTDRVGEYALSCNRKVNCSIQSHSTHHVYYEGSNLVRGSSGGAIQWADSKLLFAMHCESANEIDFEEQEESSRIIADTKKLVRSEDSPYPTITNPPKKKKSCESETIRSLTGGNAGQGRGIILSQFKKLMYYFREIESNP